MKDPIKKLKNFQKLNVLGPNHVVVVFENGNLLQSYDSVIAVKLDNTTYLTSKWDYSSTTGKYRNLYLNEIKSETQTKINNGVYTLV